ncbi:MAG: hypothetical protein FWH55_07975 [Oscillospiraceae bacterium]|nr:hypothetical protein [Oscillospiraceae bacterium]
MDKNTGIWFRDTWRVIRRVLQSVAWRVVEAELDIGSDQEGYFEWKEMYRNDSGRRTGQ